LGNTRRGGGSGFHWFGYQRWLGNVPMINSFTVDGDANSGRDNY
jgi:hypothetical protein